MRVLLTTASALALFAAPAFAATNSTAPGAGASGATTSGSTASQSTANPGAAPSTKAMGSQNGTSQTGTSQGGTSQSASNAASANNANSAKQADQTFVKQAASGNIAEVQTGKLAAQKSHNPAVQEFGRWMETDHTMANALLTQAAQSASIQVPTTPNSSDMRSMGKLQKPNGARFNHQYIDGEMTDHQKTIMLFQNEAKSGQDAKLQSYAKAMLPALQAHLQEAQALQSNPSRRTASGAGGSTATGNTAVGAGDAGTARLNQQELNKIQHR